MSILNPKWISLLGALAGVALLSGCTRDFKPQDVSMWNGTRLKPLEPLGEDEPGARFDVALPPAELADAIVARLSAPIG